MTHRKYRKRRRNRKRDQQRKNFGFSPLQELIQKELAHFYHKRLVEIVRGIASENSRMLRDGEVFLRPLARSNRRSAFAEFSKQVIDQCYESLNIPRELFQPCSIVEPDQVRSPSGTESSELTIGSAVSSLNTEN